MIVTFRNSVTKDIALGLKNKETVKLLPAELHDKAKIRLFALSSAKSLSDLLIPGWRLEKLKGNRLGQYSIRINDKYRICFVWKKQGVFEVEIIDYH